MSNIALGLVFAISDAFLFGVQYLPCKSYNTYDGATFQYFMTCGIIGGGCLLELVGLGLMGWNEEQTPQVVLLGIAGGFIWATSNALVIPLMKLCGVALGFSLYHVINICTGYATSRFGLLGMDKDQGKINALRDVGICIVMSSFVILFFVEPEQDKFAKVEESSTGTSGSGRKLGDRSSLLRERDNSNNGENEQQDSKTNLSIHIDDADTDAETRGAVFPKNHPTSSLNKLSSIQKRILGCCIAVVAGVLCGLNNWPYSLYTQKDYAYKVSPLQYTFSQTIGCYLAGCLWYWLYSTINSIRRKETPHSVLRPAFISGIIWVIGNILQLYAIDYCGYALAYTIGAVGPTMVASVISIFYFKEVSDTKQRILYGIALSLQLVGVIMVAIGT